MTGAGVTVRSNSNADSPLSQKVTVKNEAKESMSKKKKRRLGTSLVAASLLMLSAAPVVAQDSGKAADKQADRPTVSKKKAVASSTTVNLVNLLIAQGTLTEEQGAALIKQAEEEAYIAREAARDATAKADDAAKAATAAAAAASPPGSKRVTYVPEIVKRQLRDDIRKEVMAQAKAENWASPGKYPEWAQRIRFSGDIRGRYEGIWYPGGGYNSTGQIYDFNSINTGSGYDVSDLTQTNPPLYNTTQDRSRFRLRARLGMEADLYEGFTVGMRIATGSDSAPTSTNQTLGGSGGNFSKYAIWLDRAFIKFEPFKNPGVTGLTGISGAPNSVAINVGRFDNPFWSPTDLVWNTNLGFDGIAAQAAYEVLPGFTPFAVGGAFPIFNTSLDLASTKDVKFDSADRYLFGGQLGFNWNVAPMVGLTFGAAYYDFSNVQGRLSSPCDISIGYPCDTDQYRPTFAQKGNTYMPLRDITTPAGWAGGLYTQTQYFGLASAFRPVTLSARLDLSHFDPINIRIDGEYVWNTAFDKNAIGVVAVNNRQQDIISNTPGPFEGGNHGWMTRLTVGNTKIANFGDWNAHIGYKYLESDAMIDAFVDSDFGLGGTNLKGYFVGANYGLAQNVWATARWMSANAIAGPPYAVDVFQLDLNAKF